MVKHQQAIKFSEYDATRVVANCIDTQNASPIKQSAYRVPKSQRDEIERQVLRLKEHKLVEDSRSPWSLPVVLFRKKD
jgi:hypothetical protein